MAYLKQKIGQSIYDMCLLTYGTLDYLVKLCVDNNVTDMGNPPQQVDYYYDEKIVLNNLSSNYKYATDTNSGGRVFSSEFGIEFS